MEDIALLKKLDFFSGLGMMELTKINTLAKRAVFKKGTDVVLEKTPCAALYIVKTGRVRVSKDGREIAVLGEGSPIGEVSFIDKGPRSASVTALEDTVFIVIPSDGFQELMDREQELASKVYRAIALLLCGRLRETNKLMLSPNG